MPPRGKKSVWANRIVGEADVPPDQLLANPANPRRHPGRQRDALRHALGTVGWIQRIIVNQTTGNVIDGHARVEEALTAGAKTVPVVYVKLSVEEEKDALALFDQIGAMATMDDEAWGALLAETSDPALLEGLLSDVTDLPAGPVGEDDDVSLAVDGRSPVTVLGDVWVLGRHRLVCGDCTNPLTYDALLRGDLCGLLVTDPPYGVDYENTIAGSGGGDALRRRESGLPENRGRASSRISGDKTASAAIELWTGAFPIAAVALAPGASFYVTGPPGPLNFDLHSALRDAGLAPRHTIIWVKEQFVLGRSDYQYQHEPILYGWTEGKAHTWRGGRKQTSVWEITKPSRSPEHPTMKPVELYARAIRNSSADDALVLDPFAGSGTLAVACEETGRTARMIELDPAYCDVIVRRWQAKTGDIAVNETSGEPFPVEVVVTKGQPA